MRMFRGVVVAVAAGLLTMGAVQPATTASAVTMTANAITPAEIYPDAHAHNDYLNDEPLTGALGHGFTSVEADVWLDGGRLALCHDMDGEQCESDVSWPHDGSTNSDIPKRYLDDTYLKPLMDQVTANNGRVYANYSGHFYLVIEIKCQQSGTTCSSGVPDRTWTEIRRELVEYQSLYSGPGQLFSSRIGETPQPGAVDVVITGGHNEEKDADHVSVGTQLRDGSTDQIARLDGHLSTTGTAPWNTAMISFGWTPGDTCAFDPSGIWDQFDAIRQAHAAGYVTRLYGEPDCPHRHAPADPAQTHDQQAAWTYVFNEVHCDLTYLSSDHLQLLPTFLDDVDWADGCGGSGGGGGGGGSGPVATSLSYTGPTTAEYHHPFTASAELDSADGPVSGVAVDFTLGQSDSCVGVTNSAGTAACRLDPDAAAGPVALRIHFSGNDSYSSSDITVSFTITKEKTVLAYTGTQHLANGTPVHLSAVLRADDGTAVGGRSVGFTLGTGNTAQTCRATTDSAGTAACAIGTVNQPLTASATVPLAAGFAGDAFYLPSTASAALRLEYMTGRAYGVSASLPLLGVAPTPDTGVVRTAFATTTAPPCTAGVDAVVLSASGLCPKVVTTIAPGSVTATSTVSDVTIGLLGLPVIELSGVTATSTSDCASATGSAQVTVTVAGQPVTVPTRPNSVVDLAGGVRLVVDEQVPAADADHGLTVNAVHLTAAGGVDVVVGSTTSGSHNCS
jgi:hypothetical protein